MYLKSPSIDMICLSLSFVLSCVVYLTLLTRAMVDISMDGDESKPVPSSSALQEKLRTFVFFLVIVLLLRHQHHLDRVVVCVAIVFSSDGFDQGRREKPMQLFA